MASFLTNVFRLLKYVIIGLRKDPEFRTLLFFIVVLLVGSTIFYHKTEDWSIIDSLYFSVMTMSTIGYGDFSPTTTLSKVFTIIFTFLSIGCFATLTAKIVSVVLRKKKGHH